MSNQALDGAIISAARETLEVAVASNPVKWVKKPVPFHACAWRRVFVQA